MNKNNLLDCPAFLKDFLFYLETIRGLSSRTVDGYYIDLRTFLRFVKMGKSWPLLKIPRLKKSPLRMWTSHF